MPTEYFYLRNGHQYGPVTGAQLKELVRNGQLDRQDLVWREGFPQWRPAGKAEGLFTGTELSRRKQRPQDRNLPKPPPLPARRSNTPVVWFWLVFGLLVLLTAGVGGLLIVGRGFPSQDSAVASSVPAANLREVKVPQQAEEVAPAEPEPVEKKEAATVEVHPQRDPASKTETPAQAIAERERLDRKYTATRREIEATVESQIPQRELDHQILVLYNLAETAGLTDPQLRELFQRAVVEAKRQGLPTPFALDSLEGSIAFRIALNGQRQDTSEPLAPLSELDLPSSLSFQEFSRRFPEARRIGRRGVLDEWRIDEPPNQQKYFRFAADGRLAAIALQRWYADSQSAHKPLDDLKTAVHPDLVDTKGRGPFLYTWVRPEEGLMMRCSVGLEDATRTPYPGLRYVLTVEIIDLKLAERCRAGRASQMT